MAPGRRPLRLRQSRRGLAGSRYGEKHRGAVLVGEARLENAQEEEGLRAFALRVGAREGADSAGPPLWVERDGVRSDLAEVVSTWCEEERIGFRARLAGGALILLYYVPELDLWSGAWSPDGKKPRIIRRRQ